MSNTTEDNTKRALQGCESNGGVNCKIFGETGGPEAIAVSRGTGGFSIASNIDPQVASNKAHKMCNEKFNNCKFDGVYWVPETLFASIAGNHTDDGRVYQTYFSYKFANQEDADTAALKGCKERARADCTIFKRFHSKVTYAEGEGKAGNFYATGETTKIAKDLILKKCFIENKNFPNSCKITLIAENPAPTAEPKNFQSVYEKTTVAREKREGAKNQGNVKQVYTNQRNVVNCHNQCFNGDCLRTFSDGRKERWQAPRVFDPFTNDWKWETSSCGN